MDFRRVYLIISILSLVVLTVVTILVFMEESCAGHGECVQLEHLIYKGTDTVLDRDVYYSLNRRESTFSAFGTGFNVTSEPVYNIEANTFTVSLDYGNNTVVPTTFQRNLNLNTADILVYAGDKANQRTIPLRLTTFQDLSTLLKKATTVL